MQVHTIPRFQSLFERYPFDFIILSIHQVDDKEFWTQDFQKGKSQREYNWRYYEEMLEVVKKYKNLYRELGGEIITVGSDSHRPEHLGTYITDAKNLLKSLGFGYFCTYDKMEPIYHKL